MNKKINLTRKIQLVVDSKDGDFIGEVYTKLRSWQNITFRAANFIVSHYYVQSQLKDFFYLTEDIRYKLGDQNKDENGAFITSRMNTFNRLLSQKYKGQIPIQSFASLINNLFPILNKQSAEYWSGERSVSNFKRDAPIYVPSRDIRHIKATEDGRNFRFDIFSIPFRTYFGRDFHDKRQLFEDAYKGKIKLCASTIKIESKKIFLLTSFQVEQQKTAVDKNIIAEASLSLEYPVVVTIGKYKYQIGNKEEFLYRRLAIQAARLRNLKSAKYNHGGKGREKKLKNVIRLDGKEKSYVDYKLHLYSRRLIDLCIKHGAGTLLLTEQQEKEVVAKEDVFLLRNWSYYGLKQKIEYKAERLGIKIINE